MSGDKKPLSSQDALRQSGWQSRAGAATPTQQSAETSIPAQPAGRTPAKPKEGQEVADFIDQIKRMPQQTTAGAGRLLFAMDATMSRQPTWDLALKLQGDMFHAVKEIGGLDVQLIYFRGLNECRSSKWVSDPEALASLMTKIDCRGGNTQIGRVLTHGAEEGAKKRVNAMVYVGDCMEENIDSLCHRAGELALRGCPVFLFHEGYDSRAERAFREIARITKGAYCRFDAGSAKQLRDLLSAVAVYAAGGRKALERLSQRQDSARLLLEQMK